MKVIKPNKLSGLTRCFEYRRRFHLGVAMFMFVRMGEDSPDLLSEMALWRFISERMPGVPLDEGMPKSRGEYLVQGSAFAEGGAPCSSVPVRARVGPLEKTLAVTGDRYWVGPRQSSSPQPFDRMALDWTRAYGGPDDDRNPHGRGQVKVEVGGELVVPLPNVERPGREVRAQRERGEPTGFLPLEIGWPQRQQLAGTYDQAWLENAFPGLANDIDWAFFNVASADQQREGPWSAGDVYEFQNLHPTQPILRGRLPGLTARVFVSTDAQGRSLEEVSMALQTLWFFPDSERMVLVFNGSVPVGSDDASDVQHLVLAAEGSKTERSRDHYERVVAGRLDPDRGAVAALRDEDLLPVGVSGSLSELAEADGDEPEGLLAANLHRRAIAEHTAMVEQLTKLGVELSMMPDAPEPAAPPPTLEELPALAEKLLAEAAERQAQAEREIEQTRDLVAGRAREVGVDSKPFLDEQDPTGGPPTWTAEGQRSELLAAIASCRAAGADSEPFESMLEDRELQAAWEQAEIQMREGYRVSAHLQAPAPHRDGDDRDEVRAFVLRAAADGEDFSLLNLTGADLSGLDLRGANLRGALLERANLDGVDLRGADLSRAVLAHASLREAVLDECNLHDANLGKALLERASMREATLRSTIVDGAVLRGATLAGSRLVDVRLTELSLDATDLSGVVAEGLVVLDMALAGLSLTGASLVGSTFANVDLEGVSLARADLTRCSFVACKMVGADLSGVTLRRASFVDTCVLDGANLSGAEAASCNFRGSSMRGANLDHANLDGADLSQCVLTDATLSRATARNTRLDKADLQRVQASGANFMSASLSRADLRGANLRGSNLFGADMARIRGEGLQLTDSLLTRVRAYPQQEGEDA